MLIPLHTPLHPLSANANFQNACKLSKCSKAMSDCKSQEILSEGSLKPSLCDHVVSYPNFYLFIYLLFSYFKIIRS